ncbi:MAG: SEC-C metal-binding domain-containing protein [Steroidobacteraceae bacterium]
MDKNEQTEHVHGPDCDHEHDHDHQHGPEQPYRREAPKLGRNDPCFCGSGKKFKKCHGG